MPLYMNSATLWFKALCGLASSSDYRKMHFIVQNYKEIWRPEKWATSFSLRSFIFSILKAIGSLIRFLVKLWSLWCEKLTEVNFSAQSSLSWDVAPGFPSQRNIFLLSFFLFSCGLSHTFLLQGNCVSLEWDKCSHVQDVDNLRNIETLELGRCYGLNVCVSSKFMCWSPNSQCGCMWRWGL